MFGLIVIASFVIGYGYAFYGLKNEYIVIRMPNGQRVRYDKATQARGFYVTIGLFLVAPIGILIMYCLLYTSPSPRDQRGSRMPSSA